MASYKNPFDLYENPLVWIALIGLVLVVVLKELLIIVSTSKLEKFEFKLKKNIGIEKHVGKFRKCVCGCKNVFVVAKIYFGLQKCIFGC